MFLRIPFLKMDETTDGGAGGGGGSGGTKDQVSHDTFSKVLSEKKKTQVENQELKNKLQVYEQEKLETDGKLKEANENLKKTLAESKQKNADLAKTVTNKVLFQQFAREAEKLGCVDVKLAYSAVNLDDVDVTEELELDTKKLQEKLSNLSKEKAFLFNKQIKETKDLNVKVTDGDGSKSKDLSELDEKQLKALLSKAL